VTLGPGEAFPRAKELIVKALELDPNSSDAHAAAGNLAYQQDLDWAVAEAEFKRAISLNPSNVSAHWWFTDLLIVLQRYEEAKEENRIVIQLDPLWESPKIGRATIDSLAGDIESAIARVEEILARNPDYYHTHGVLGWLYLIAGRKDQARKEAEILTELPFSSGLDYEFLRRQRASLWAALGKPDEARQLVGEWEEASGTTYINLVTKAMIYAALGEREKAIEALERAHREGERWLPWSYSAVVFDSIRDDPRFRAMLEKLNLPTKLSRPRWSPKVSPER
jgi:serine/threonine-protein kinase